VLDDARLRDGRENVGDAAQNMFFADLGGEFGFVVEAVL
jgi:hypothetical protein